MPTRRTAPAAHPTGDNRRRVTKHDDDCPIQAFRVDSNAPYIPHDAPCDQLAQQITEGNVAQTEQVASVRTAPASNAPAPKTRPAKNARTKKEPTIIPLASEMVNGIVVYDVDFLAIKQELYVKRTTTNYHNLWVDQKGETKYGDAVLGGTGALHNQAANLVENQIVEQWYFTEGTKITANGIALN